MIFKKKKKSPAPAIELFDSHCHLDFEAFDGNRENLVDKSRKEGISGILIPAVTKERWRLVRQLAARYPGIYSALGLHPMFMDEHQDRHLRDLEMALSIKPVWAVGEIGLDHYDKGADRAAQYQLFKAQVAIAGNARLPLILHVRKAHEEVLRLLRHNRFEFGGIIHAFNGSAEQASRYRDLGFKFGFGGAITYPRAVKLRTLVGDLPLTDIVLETDAPDMPPISCEKGKNTPLHLFDNFRTLCELREEPPHEIARQTTANVREVLNIS